MLAENPTLFIRLHPHVAVVLCWLLLTSAAGARAGEPQSEFTTAPLVERTEPRDLRELLATVPETRPLRVTLTTRETVIGHPWRVYGDTLLLIPPEIYEQDGGAPAAATLLRAPVTQIVQVEQRRSGAASGAGWGARSGAFVGGGLGVLLGAVLVSLSDDDDGVAVPVVMLGLLGGASGAVAGGGIGAGLGALSRDWHSLWPFDESGGAASDAAYGGSAGTRLCLEAGWSVDDDADQGGRGLGGRLLFLRRIGTWLEMGPAIEYHDVSGWYWYQSYYGGTWQNSTSDALGLGLDVRAHGTARGARAFGTFGLGWRAGGDLYLGAHAGGGLRWRAKSGNEIALALRRYFALHRTESETAEFWTLSAGMTFGN